MPLNWLPLRSTDLTLILAVGMAGVDVVVEVVVLVAELVVVEVDAVLMLEVEVEEIVVEIVVELGAPWSRAATSFMK